jgi:aryl-alcohol dehydrogenase-like predicted oxidoreductase
LLLHRPEQLLGGAGTALLSALEQHRASGRVRRLGISIYSPEDLDALHDLARWDIVQAPLNILDRRIVSSGWAGRLRAEGIEVQARSIFLQGLLLLEQGERPPRFDRWQSTWTDWARWKIEQGLGAMEACLRFAYSIPEIDTVVLGVDGWQQLEEILSVPRVPLRQLPDWQIPAAADLINPSLWNDE